MGSLTTLIHLSLSWIGWSPSLDAGHAELPVQSPWGFGELASC